MSQLTRLNTHSHSRETAGPACGVWLFNEPMDAGEIDSKNSTRLLRSRRYGSFWFASLLSNIGTWMQSVAEPWLVLEISGSSFLVGVDAFATNAPFWILTLVGGILADRKDRGADQQSNFEPAVLSFVQRPGGIPKVFLKCRVRWLWSAKQHRFATSASGVFRSINEQANSRRRRTRYR